MRPRRFSWTWAWVDKTVTTLTAINDLMFDSFEVRKVLIVAPLRVARDIWAAEIHKWEHLSDLRYSIAIGSVAQRREALTAKADIYIINRENVQWLVEQSGLSFDYDMLVIDELSSFKSHQSKRFKALMRVRPKVKRIVGLTGTPSSNGLMDLYAEFRLLDMGQRLGRFIGQYRENYFLPDKRNGMVVYSYKPQRDAEQRIYDKISDITISMKAGEHLKMPELVMTEYAVSLSEEEQQYYDDLKKEMVLELGDTVIDAVNAASLSNKLLQMANGAVYDENKEVITVHDLKLDALEDIVEAANGKPVLIAYWFKHDLQRIQERIKGATLDSAANIRKWNEGKIPVAFIHPASAGHGLNLQSGGSTLVWFGLTWSLELYQQTNARLWRQGQQSETVVIQHIIATGTIDEQVMKALREKDKTQTALMDAVRAELEVET